MHIELTDHLRCPMSHEESFVVLLPERMDGRRVLSGHLGCPTCGWGTAWDDAIPAFGGGIPAEGRPAVDADGAVALLGLDGPGGWVVLAGRAGALVGGVREALPGVGLVLLNPPPEATPDAVVSVLRSAVWPIKRHAMRGIVLGEDAAAMAVPALGSVLPGLRLAGEGAPPPLGPGDTVLGEAGGVWVVRKG